jgi:hypothetical protein
LFKDNYGNPYIYTQSQLIVISVIAGKYCPRVEVILPSQYGKSEAVAQGTLLAMLARPEDFALVAPTQNKTEIIMGYIIQHIFDHQVFLEQLVYDDSLEKLKQRKNQTHITFKLGSAIQAFSGDARNTQQVQRALMGFGAPNLVIDESPLLPNNLYATAKRMVGGTDDNFIFEIGNPFNREHFMRTWLSPRYKRLWVDYNQAIVEGRMSQSFIDEMKDEAFFDVLYACHFPTDIDAPTGYRRLITQALLDNSIILDEPEVKPEYQPILGVDIARGGRNQSVYVLRYPQSHAKVLEKNHDADLMNQVQRIIKYKNDYNINDYRIAVDDVGVGSGVTDALRSKGILCQAIREGESADAKDRYANKKAEMYWRLRTWLHDGKKLLHDEDWSELREINFKENTSSKLQMESKSDMLKRGIQSPDTADALMLTMINENAIITADDFAL